MSSGKPEDWENTKKQLVNPDPVSKNKTWLGHHVKKQSGTIDLMVLQGKYSIKEIAEEIDRISDIDMPFDARIKRVEDHLDHLQTGDSRGKASGMKPHKLRIVKGANDKIKFFLG